MRFFLWQNNVSQSTRFDFIIIIIVTVIFCCAGSSLWYVGFSTCGAQAQFSRSVWGLIPWPGTSFALKGEFLTTGPPGKSLPHALSFKCLSINTGLNIVNSGFNKFNSWETYMQVRKRQLELDMEEQTGSK